MLDVNSTILEVTENFIGLFRFLVFVSVSGQYQQFLMVSELVKYVIQVPIPIVSALSTLK